MKQNKTKMKNKFLLWIAGDFDLDEDEKLPEPGESGEPELGHRSFDFSEFKHKKFVHVVYVLLGVFCLFSLCGLLMATVAEMPKFGTDAEQMDMVSYEYLEHGLQETGTVNIITGIILEYRGFDTLGESFVLFCAVTCVLSILLADSHDDTAVKSAKLEFSDLSGDPIMRKTATAIIPLILIFGIYIILNGHLSPGGGFSGGAVIGAALILLSAAFGEDASGRFMSERNYKIISFVALSSYCFMKSYTFYTGANGLPLGVGHGTIGNIFSAGFVLPLNIAVGMVVASTMYSIYRVLGWRRF